MSLVDGPRDGGVISVKLGALTLVDRKGTDPVTPTISHYKEQRPGTEVERSVALADGINQEFEFTGSFDDLRRKPVTFSLKIGGSTLVASLNIDSFALRKGKPVVRNLPLASEVITVGDKAVGTLSVIVTWRLYKAPKSLFQRMSIMVAVGGGFKKPKASAGSAALDARAQAAKSLQSSGPMDPMTRMKAREAATETLQAAFRFFDVDASGALSKEEMLNVLMHVVPNGEEPMNEEDAMAFITDFDVNDDDELNVDEFCKGMVALVVPEVMDDGIVTTKEMDKGLGSAAEAVADVAKQQLTAESAGSWAEGVVNADQRVAHFRSKAKAYSFRYAKAEADAKAREAA